MTLGREEAIANSWPDEQKPNTKAYQADKLAKDSEVPKGNRNLDTYDAKEPRLTGTAYWESAFGQRGHRVWAELSGVSLTNRSRLDFVGTDRASTLSYMTYLEHNDINTSGVSLNNDYSFYLDDKHKNILEAGVKVSLSATTNYRDHDS